MKALRKIGRTLAIAAGVALAFGACDEQLEGGMACPALCPQEETEVRDTTLFAVDLDTAVAGFPTLGNELTLFLADFGDTLDTRAVVRFDSLTPTFRRTNSAEEEQFTALDSNTHVKFFLVTEDTLGPPTTIEVYDVDMDGADNDDPTAVRDVYTLDRLLGSKTIDALSARDSVLIPVDGSRLLAKINTPPPGNRLRLGVKINTAGGGARHVTLRSISGGPAELRYRQEGDTTIPVVRVFPRSISPADNFVNEALADYVVVVTAPPEPLPIVFRVGGAAGRRVYMRFDIPPSLLDSTSIVRASLVLTQHPNRFSPEAEDTVAVQHLLVTAAPTVTDLARAMLLIAPPGILFNRNRTTDSVRVFAADTGLRTIEVIDAVRSWRGTSAAKTPRAIVLRSTLEGTRPRQADFFSLEAPVEVRPRLRITFVKRREDGLP